ncbi:hypothetical protein ACFLUS_04880 [Chloroflexota bacterium]
MGLKVLNLREWLTAHILLVVGLVLITVGLLQGVMPLTVGGIWAIALGLCLVVGSAFKKLVEK